jgi:hypothetical protein
VPRTGVNHNVAPPAVADPTLWSWRAALERAVRYHAVTGRKCRVGRDPKGRWHSTVVSNMCSTR